MQVESRAGCTHPMNVSFCRATMTMRISRQSRLLMSWPRSRICARRPGLPLLSVQFSRQVRLLMLCRAAGHARPTLHHVARRLFVTPWGDHLPSTMCVVCMTRAVRPQTLVVVRQNS